MSTFDFDNWSIRRSILRVPSQTASPCTFHVAIDSSSTVVIAAVVVEGLHFVASDVSVAILGRDTPESILYVWSNSMVLY